LGFCFNSTRNNSEEHENGEMHKA
ncbi:hypothetical protein D039_2935B, partial [Vibrio parahaemolyticus EKP-028]